MKSEEIISIFCFDRRNPYVCWNPREVQIANILISYPWVYGIYNTATFGIQDQVSVMDRLRRMNSIMENSKCANKVKQKNVCWFIYSLWYRDPWKPLSVSINCNLVWCDNRTLQANEYNTQDNEKLLQFLDKSTPMYEVYTIK